MTSLTDTDWGPAGVAHRVTWHDPAKPAAPGLSHARHRLPASDGGR